MDNLLIPKDSTVSKKQLVQDKLVQLIKENKFSKGDKLPSERDLARLLNVSRNVLREAIVTLAGIGALEVRERQGIFVKKQDDFGITDNLQNLQALPSDLVTYQMEARIIISVPAARMAAERRTEEDLKKLWECYENFVNCPYQTEEEQMQNSRWEALLHYLVVEAAHNPVISRINESINSFVERNNLLVHPDLINEKGWMEHIKEQHKNIITAIVDKDPILAGDILKKHMLESIFLMEKNYPHIKSRFSHPYWAL